MKPLRHLRRARLSVLVQGGGIGLCAAIVALVYPSLYGDGGLRDGRRLVSFSTNWSPSYPMPLEDYEAVAATSRSYEWTEAVRTFNTSLTADGRTRVEIGSYVSPSLFQRLAVRPVRGRLFEPADADPPAPVVALVSHRLWQGALGAAPDVVGTTLEINRELATIVGVLPPGMHFPLRHDVWVPLRRSGRSWSQGWVFGIGMLRPGVAASQARDELERLAARLDRESPDATGGEARIAAVEPYVQAHLGDSNIAVLEGLLLGVGALLALVLGNLWVLRRVEQTRRTRELTTRRALGASPLHLLRLAAGELAARSLAAGAPGAALVAVTLPLLRWLLSGSSLARLPWTAPDLSAASSPASCSRWPCPWSPSPAAPRRSPSAWCAPLAANASWRCAPRAPRHTSASSSSRLRSVSRPRSASLPSGWPTPPVVGCCSRRASSPRVCTPWC